MLCQLLPMSFSRRREKQSQRRCKHPKTQDRMKQVTNPLNQESTKYDYQIEKLKGDLIFCSSRTATMGEIERNRKKERIGKWGDAEDRRDFFFHHRRKPKLSWKFTKMPLKFSTWNYRNATTLIFFFFKY